MKVLLAVAVAASLVYASIASAFTPSFLAPIAFAGLAIQNIQRTFFCTNCLRDAALNNTARGVLYDRLSGGKLSSRGPSNGSSSRISSPPPSPNFSDGSARR
jgi:Na+-transporting methylmalonyl-CoA/oxaloacetate decarboxylase beta subunit